MREFAPSQPPPSEAGNHRPIVPSNCQDEHPMIIEEGILRALCKKPGTGDFPYPEIPPGGELQLLRREYPQLSRLIRGKRIVDFGCGAGRQAVALAAEEGCVVTGLDTSPKSLAKARALAAEKGVPQDRVRFLDRPADDMLHTFDAVISQNAMEHFPDPKDILRRMKELIHPQGIILITFGPPWLAPYGSHMNFFCRVPWVNILFSESTVMKVRTLYRSDGAKHYTEVEAGLNKITVSGFERLIAGSGLFIRYRRYRGVKGLDRLTRIPLLRELFTYQLSVILTLSETVRIES
jgi:SAM-dependent methyltransferase